MSVANINSLARLKIDIKERLTTPTRSITFYTYLILSVVGGGGLGVWYYLYSIAFQNEPYCNKVMSAALFTYFPSVVAAGFLETARERQPYWRSFGQLIGFIFAILFLLAVSFSGKTQLVTAALSSVLAVLFWWVANGDKDFFADISTESSVNAPTSMPLAKSKSIDSNTFQQ